MGIESAKVAEKKTTRHQKESRQKSRQDSLKAHRHSEKKKSQDNGLLKVVRLSELQI